MGKEVYARKATFKVTLVKGVKKFTAVNKRAHTVCKKAGHRSVISGKELKALVGKGSYKFYYYNEKGNLLPVRFGAKG